MLKRISLVTVVAFMVAFMQPAVEAQAVTIFDPIISVSNSTRSSVDVSWATQRASDDTLITTYSLAVSADGGITWNEQAATIAVDYAFPVVKVRYSLPAASARMFKVASVLGSSRSNWSNEEIGVTSGTRQSRILIETMGGAPLSGGAVSWELSSGRAKSSVQYGLTSEGYLDLPAVPAGAAVVHLTNGLLADGTRVSGNFNAFFGFDPTTLRVPSPPQSIRTVKVELPGGLPVAGATVTVAGDLASQMTIQGFTFSLPSTSLQSVSADYSVDDWYDYWDYYTGGVVLSGVTDSLGRFNVYGYTNTVPAVQVSYDDGVISQTVDGQLNAYNTKLQLDYEPYVSPLNLVVTATEGDVALVPIEMTDPAAVAPAVLEVRAAIFGAVSPASAGYTVSLVRPAGVSKGKCGASSTASVAIGSSANIRVCATQSGYYRIAAGKGALAAGYVALHVKGAAPMAPTKASVASSAKGKAKVKWSAPEYSGGTSIKKYVVHAILGKSTIKRTFSASSKSATFTGLKHASRYAFKIFAVTKNGTSVPVTVSTVVS